MSNGMEYPEGATPLDPDEMEGLLHPHVTTRGELDHLEAANISEGARWLERQKSIDVLTDEFARQYHQNLFGQVWRWAGQYRNSEKNIGIDPVQISVQLRSLMDDVRFWVENETYDPVEAAIRFHHRLVYIHPFPNGNGRHARYMADALLERVYDREPLDWSGGYDLQEMNNRRKDYIAALQAADGFDYEPLFNFIGYENKGSKS